MDNEFEKQEEIQQPEVPQSMQEPVTEDTAVPEETIFQQPELPRFEESSSEYRWVNPHIQPEPARQKKKKPKKVKKILKTMLKSNLIMKIVIIQLIVRIIRSKLMSTMVGKIVLLFQTKLMEKR